MKVCSKCKTKKELCEYSKRKAVKNGLRSECKICSSERKKQYREENRDKISEYHKQYHEENRDKLNERQKQYYEANRDKVNERSKRYYEANRDKVNERHKLRYNSDVKFKIKKTLRHRLRSVLKSQNAKKTQSVLALTGCTIDFLKQHLAGRFKEGMSWDNHGEWHIDHIRPCASFDLTDEKQQRLCFHYTNLQPLWGHENISKGDKWEQ